MEGPLRSFSKPDQLIWLSVYVVALTWHMTALPVQYYFRHFTLTRGYRLPTHRILLLAAFGFLVALLTGILSHPAYGMSNAVRPGFNYNELWYPDEDGEDVFYADTRSSTMSLYFVWSSLVATTSYLLLPYICYRTVRHFHKKGATVSRRSENMQRQLTRFLKIQTIMPLFVSTGPNIFLFITSALRIDPGILCAIIIDLITLLPIANPILSIWAIKPYRRAIRKLFEKEDTAIRPVFRINNITVGRQSSLTSDSRFSRFGIVLLRATAEILKPFGMRPET
ncbi:unnamed protein product [Bursaphelenchus xylophilus]|uniref:(pine wood nematode) hypothetical protein n=1 Tax=Bursaphelenchus xylophilus TaxID=6326 RepID=A0A1I7SEF4_BURXY|nr:unnamed protein product [Bursaphelenchus xylophilus]CAG9104002.1 unnamed protein product [Bursaphelenchus xylophilus]